MSWTASSRTSSSRSRRAKSLAAASLWLLAGCMHPREGARAELLSNERLWIVEAEQPAHVSFQGGILDIDSPAGVTVWLQREITTPVEIEFDATAVSAGGPNDHVSDLNVFWMARNVDGSAPYRTGRSGRFEEYDDLLTYYVGLGGNRNTTSRFRRYVGRLGERQLMPQHDLAFPEALLVPNRKQTVVLVADRHRIEYKRDGQTLFSFDDPQPYTSGWFAFRTTKSHLRIERFRRLTAR
jgi:hypothetical protein